MDALEALRTLGRELEIFLRNKGEHKENIVNKSKKSLAQTSVKLSNNSIWRY